jgi:hypothetical protein
MAAAAARVERRSCTRWCTVGRGDGAGLLGQERRAMAERRGNLVGWSGEWGKRRAPRDGGQFWSSLFLGLTTAFHAQQHASLPKSTEQ